ncbi:hypothetical protein QCA50_007175 [Cerrena zonata]|uniref:Uncharacterized protein n=1 Tax=Cerrena zonata TaxID=2478898 RepID=A0AAW0G7J8_9APHY
MHEDEVGQMREGSATPPTPSSVPGIYKNSAAAAMASNGQLAGGEPRTAIPRNSSVPSISMRAPFLSPASRPTSTLWYPPSYPAYPGSPNPSDTVYPPGSDQPSVPYLPASGSNPYLARKTKAPLPSSRLVQKLTKEEKPWIGEKMGEAGQVGG